MFSPHSFWLQRRILQLQASVYASCRLYYPLDTPHTPWGCAPVQLCFVAALPSATTSTQLAEPHMSSRRCGISFPLWTTAAWRRLARQAEAVADHRQYPALSTPRLTRPSINLGYGDESFWFRFFSRCRCPWRCATHSSRATPSLWTLGHLIFQVESARWLLIGGSGGSVMPAPGSAAELHLVNWLFRLISLWVYLPGSGFSVILAWNCRNRDEAYFLQHGAPNTPSFLRETVLFSISFVCGTQFARPFLFAAMSRKRALLNSRFLYMIVWYLYTLDRDSRFGFRRTYKTFTFFPLPPHSMQEPIRLTSQRELLSWLRVFWYSSLIQHALVLICKIHRWGELPQGWYVFILFRNFVPIHQNE